MYLLEEEQDVRLMTPEIIQFIVGQVGVAGVAYFALLMVERSYKESLRREEQVNRQLDVLLNRVLSTLEKNSETNSALLHTINELGDRVLYSSRPGKSNESP